MNLNNWNTAQAHRAETTWGKNYPSYIIDMYEHAIRGSRILDLGCGFGRFYDWLTAYDVPVTYTGYDSSQSMLDRFTAKHPNTNLVHQDITSPFNEDIDSLICAAVLIHLTLADQTKILSNIKAAKPNYLSFDINSPSEEWLTRGTHFERVMPPGFRMTWQSHYEMTKQVIKVFPNYDLTIKLYPLHKVRHKVIYLLKRREC